MIKHFVISQIGAVKEKIIRSREMRNREKITVVDHRRGLDRWVNLSRFRESGNEKAESSELAKCEILK